MSTRIPPPPSFDIGQFKAVLMGVKFIGNGATDFRSLQIINNALSEGVIQNKLSMDDATSLMSWLSLLMSPVPSEVTTEQPHKQQTRSFGDRQFGSPCITRPLPSDEELKSGLRSTPKPPEESTTHVVGTMVDGSSINATVDTTYNEVEAFLKLDILQMQRKHMVAYENIVTANMHIPGHYVTALRIMVEQGFVNVRNQSQLELLDRELEKVEAAILVDDDSAVTVALSEADTFIGSLADISDAPSSGVDQYREVNAERKSIYSGVDFSDPLDFTAEKVAQYGSVLIKSLPSATEWFNQGTLDYARGVQNTLSKLLPFAKCAADISVVDAIIFPITVASREKMFDTIAVVDTNLDCLLNHVAAGDNFIPPDMIPVEAEVDLHLATAGLISKHREKIMQLDNVMIATPILRDFFANWKNLIRPVTTKEELSELEGVLCELSDAIGEYHPSQIEAAFAKLVKDWHI